MGETKMAAKINDYKGTFIKYLLVFSVPIIIFSTFFFYSQYSTQLENTVSLNLSRFNQFTQEVDLFYSSLQDIAISMSRDDILPDEKYDDQFTQMLWRYSEELGDDVLILYYPRGKNNIYVKDQKMTYTEFENSEYYDVSLSVSGLYSRLNNVLSTYYLPIRSVNGDEIYSTAVLFPLPLSGGEIRGSLCFLIKSDYFDNLYTEYFPGKDSQMYIMNTYFDPIYTKENIGDGNLDETIQQLAFLPVGYSEISTADSNLSVMKSRNIRTGFSYLIISESEEFFSESRTSMGILTFLSAALLLFSALMSLFIAKRYYLTLFREKQKNENISNELEHKNLLIMEIVLHKLVDGSIKDNDKASLDYNLKCANLYFSYPLFTVFTLPLEYSMTEEEVGRIQNEIERGSEGTDAYTCQRGRHNTLVIILNHDDSKDRNSLSKWLMQQLETEMKDIFIYGGSTYDSPFKIDDSYIESVYMQEHSHLDKSGIELFVKDVSAKAGFRYPEQEESIITQAVMNTSTDAALSALANIFSQINDCKSPVIQKGICYDLVNHIVRLSMEIEGEWDDDLMTKLLSYPDTSWLEQELTDLIIKLSQIQSRKMEEEIIKNRHDIISYVQEHYRDKELSLDLLSSLFSLSFSYIGRIFKDETNTTFKNYVTELRYAYVKEQLRNTDDAINDIIHNAGYSDAANYMRKFKQHEGITMGQYRLQFRKE